MRSMLNLRRRARRENFPVGSWFLPAKARRHIRAVYAFARTADDFADELALPVAGGAGDLKVAPTTDKTRIGTRDVVRSTGWDAAGQAARLALLDDYGRHLDDAIAGAPEGPIFTAIADTLRETGLPDKYLRDLLSAYKQDVTKTRYATWGTVTDYCRRSANPVGRIVLWLCGRREPELHQWSDAICTALQLTNFWQDLAIDLMEKDRCYLPREILGAHGATETDLKSGVMSPGLRAAVAEAAGRTRALFDTGRPLLDELHGLLGLEIRLTWLGGTSVLAQVERPEYDPFRERPVLSRWDWTGLTVKALAAT